MSFTTAIKKLKKVDNSHESRKSINIKNFFQPRSNASRAGTNIEPWNNRNRGLRLYNFRYDCYLNSAVNSIASSPIIREELQQQQPSISIAQRSVINELCGLLSSAYPVKSVRSLKESLRICYPDIQSYSSENQEDACQAFFDIVRRLPRLENKLKIISRKIWT